jgi:hypothetical protein
LHRFGPARPGVSPNSSRCIKKSVASVRNLPVEYSRVVFLGGKTAQCSKTRYPDTLKLRHVATCLHIFIYNYTASYHVQNIASLTTYRMILEGALQIMCLSCACGSNLVNIRRC